MKTNSLTETERNIINELIKALENKDKSSALTSAEKLKKEIQTSNNLVLWVITPENLTKLQTLVCDNFNVHPMSLRPRMIIRNRRKRAIALIQLIVIALSKSTSNNK